MLNHIRKSPVLYAILYLLSDIISLLAGDSIKGEKAAIFFQTRDRKVAAEILQIAEDFTFPVEELERDRFDKIVIHIASSEEEFLQLTARLIPDWGVACAFPSEGKIVIRSPRLGKGFGERLNLILRHELCHVYLNRYLKGGKIPHWFDEGYAIYLSGEWRFRSHVSFAMALVTKSIIPLKELESSFPTPKSEAELAYLQSYTVIEYLIRLGGVEGLTHLIKTWRDRASFDSAIRYSYGMTLFQFEDAWKGWVHGRYGWILILSQVTVFWIFVTLLFAGLFMLKRKQWKRKLMRLQEVEAEEEYQEQDDDELKEPFNTMWGGWN